MSQTNEYRRFATIGVWIQECLILVACFFYLLLRIHPKLILELQPPAFLMDINFFKEFLTIPGGLTDWLSALFLLFWSSDLSSALNLTICFWLVAFLTRKWMETLTENRLIHTFHLIPAVLLTFLHSQYDFHLNITLALIINLSFLNLIIRWTPKRQVLYTGVGLIISVLLFWITGGAFLIYAVFFGVDSLIFKKQINSGLIFLVVSSVLPYAASASIFLITLKQAYLHNLISENPIIYWYIGYIISAFYLLALIVASLAKIAIIRKPFKKIAEIVRLRKLPFHWRCVIGTPILLGGAFLLTEKTYDNNIRHILEVNQSVRESRWQEVLNAAMQCSIVNPLLSCQTNIALFQSNMLLERMFAFPQFYGSVGLLMDFEWRSVWPEKTSEIYWNLGLVNESLHWAHEAFELKGPNPDILKRLGMIYMVKGDNDAAKLFFLNLKNVPFHEKIADDLVQLNENPPKLSQDSTAKYIQSCMPVEDLVASGKLTSVELELLLKRNPKNKMAFEYLIAYHLLNGNLKEIVSHFQDFRAFTYSHVPRHVQEALLVLTSMKPNVDQNQLKNLVQPVTFQRFVSYRQILHKYQQNISSARRELQIQFGDTYWYYLMYVRPDARQSENQNEFQ